MDQATNAAAYLSYEGLKKVTMLDSTLKEGENVNWVSYPHEEIPIRVHSDPSNVASLPPITVASVFQNISKRFPNRLALVVKRNGRLQTWNYGQYYADAVRFARGLIYVGADMFQGVSILGFNSPEWVIGNMGAILAGCLPAGIYTTNGPESCHYVASHCAAAVVLVENEVQLKKILSVRDRLPALKAIVQWTGEVSENIPGVYSWSSFLSLGEQQESTQVELSRRLGKITPGHCATLIYTSGTTGNPKAVMISNDNLTWVSRAFLPVIFGDVDVTAESIRVVSYLPLSHIAAQMLDIHGPLHLAGTVYFAQPDALKGSLVQTLQDVRPTHFFGVPRVWEKIEEKMRAVGAANTGLKKSLGDWAKGLGLEGSRAKLVDQDVPWGWNVANTLVFSNVKKNLGLDLVRLNLTGAAPIALKSLEYFQSLDIQIYELYGMSECTGPHSTNLPGACKVGTVGKSLVGVEMKLDNPDDKGHGEICMRGRHVFMGYLFNPEATMEAIDEDGWLHSGDIGSQDEEGFVRITGRIKELIITAGGENIPPVVIEDQIKSSLPVISNAVVIGDKRKYLICLLTLKSEPNADGQPTDQPSSVLLSFLNDIQSSATTVSEAETCPKVLEAIEAGINRANSAAISRAQYIRKWKILPGDFTIEGGELTPTMKLKRRTVDAKFKAVIDELYPEDTQIMARL